VTMARADAIGLAIVFQALLRRRRPRRFAFYL
jgi:hypothetical protein